MSDPQSAPYPSAFEAYTTDYAKQQQQGLDFFSFHSPSDILAPHPDLFDTELDSSLAAFDEVQLQLLTVDSNDAYSFLRSDTPTCGPPSTITVSSESAYDSAYNDSESFYGSSSYGPASNYSFPIELEMEFQKFRVDSVSDYAALANAASAAAGGLPATVDPNSFGALPPTPPRSPEMAAASPPRAYNARSSFSDYGPSRSTASSDYFNQLGFNRTSINQSTVSPNTLSPISPVLSNAAMQRSDSEESNRGDPRKKYKCHTCPRAFARAYNLKTHMATHDPNRLKPHVCPHRSCGRSFSRKHDLGRHLVSIHRDDSLCSSNSGATKKSIGVDKATRGWCDNCGKGWIGRETECNCDIK